MESIFRGFPTQSGKTESKVEAASKDAAQIIFRLHDLTREADEIQSVPETNANAWHFLKSALEKDDDIRERLTDIIKEKFHTKEEKCRQLRDMQLYLSLLCNHIDTESKKN